MDVVCNVKVVVVWMVVKVVVRVVVWMMVHLK